MDLGGRSWTHAVSAMQVAVAVILVAGALRRDLGVVVNAAFGLGVTLLPAALQRDWDVRLSPGIALWVTGAVFLHALGMAGLYESVPWWDHLTHFLSAALVAGVGYAAVRAFDEHSDGTYLPPRMTAVVVLVFTLGLGVCWEVVEFGARLATIELGLDPVLIQYGYEDTLLDLVFDAAGAVVVAALAPPRLATTVETLRARLDTIAETRRDRPTGGDSGPTDADRRE